MTSTKVFLSTMGRVVDPEDAKISVFDRGFLYGDSVYETLRTTGGKALEFPRHMKRLAMSAASIGFVVPHSNEEIAAAIAATHTETGNEESYVRVVVTRGSGPIALDPRTSASPTLVVMVAPLRLPSPADYERGVAVVVVSVDKRVGGLVDPGIKTGNYLANILALQTAIDRRGDDAILCSPSGEIAEGSTSNVFLVRDRQIRTPHVETGLLAGITRAIICEIAAGTESPVEEGNVSLAELRAADEIFLTSSVRGVMPVTRLDGQTVSGGTIGPVTQLIRARYDDYLVDAGKNES